LPIERALRYILVLLVALVLILATSSAYFASKSQLGNQATISQPFTTTETQTQIQISRIVETAPAVPPQTITEVIFVGYYEIITFRVSGNCTQGPGTVGVSSSTTTNYVFPSVVNTFFNATITTLQITNLQTLEETTTVYTGIDLETLTTTNGTSTSTTVLCPQSG
jgi:hypothetical protein